MGMDISTAEPHTVQQYSEGQLHVLRQKEARCQRLLTSVSNLLAGLRAPDSSSSLERTAEAVQDDTLSTFQESADDDMDNDELDDDIVDEDDMLDNTVQVPSLKLHVATTCINHMPELQHTIHSTCIAVHVCMTCSNHLHCLNCNTLSIPPVLQCMYA